ncbi:PAS domain S-box protein [Bosea sp. AS-1]|uniref:PAS domain S-box protein n=1 Tax=Bosea sp. AS-1 TaxID=2015316 RepID=UPI0020C0922B|nr:PAS domain S-box protein [Bosea sp. AS-1]
MTDEQPQSSQQGLPRPGADRQAAEAAAWLSAVVENSDDAILSKTLDGVIMTWNRGAERMFGFSANEAVGRSITMIIPDDRLAEETEILHRLRAGERIEHFETVRRRKDGELIDISLTVSPVRNAAGEILGASKIARDISVQKRAFAQQNLLLREMNHHIKNLFSLTAALVGLSARATKGGEALAADLSERLRALARAHALTMPELSEDATGASATTFVALLEAVLAPHASDGDPRFAISGSDAPLSGNALTSAALLLHELATNAAKYGALSVPEGRLRIELSTQGDSLRVQ